MKNRYPIYIPSKGRAHEGLTMKFLERDGIPFTIVVEPPDADAYHRAFDSFKCATIIETPFQNLGQGAVPVRNYIRDLSVERGEAFHWQLDDNIHGIRRRTHGGRRIPVNSGIAFAVAEDFTDRYTNIALTGIEYVMFAVPVAGKKEQPFHLNTRIYSCWLFRNDVPYRWRGRYNDDTDMCLQVLSGGWTTVLIRTFCCAKQTTMTSTGGMTTTYVGDGRLKMARSLERVWGGVATTHRRFDRPQHRVDWSKFDTPLIRKPDFDFDSLPPVDEYGMELKSLKGEPVPDKWLEIAIDE